MGDIIKAAIETAEKRSKTGYSAYDLEHTDFPDIKFIINDYIPEGLTILAGRPKLGKSWACLDIALAVTASNVWSAFGSIKCDPGDVLYLALEDNPRRLKSRMKKLLPEFIPWPVTLQFETQWPHLPEGAEKIRDWIDNASNPKLIIIDTLGKIRKSKAEKDSAYQADYDAIAELQMLASERGLAIVVVHHVRKAEADDPIDTVSGTLGIAGAADTILVLNRNSNGVTLYGRGRDIEEIETVVEFNKVGCRWNIIGRVEDIPKSDERAEITGILEEESQPMKPQEVADLLGKNSTAVRQMMARMARDGDINKIKRGEYTHKNYQAIDGENSKGCHNSHNVTINQTIPIPKSIVCDNVTNVTEGKV